MGNFNEWENAGCFDEDAALQLSNAGVTPDEASTMTGEDVGVGSYRDTIGYKVSNGDLSVAKALEILGK